MSPKAFKNDISTQEVTSSKMPSSPLCERRSKKLVRTNLKDTYRLIEKKCVQTFKIYILGNGFPSKIELQL
jgi:hypothetical protein